MQLNSYDIILSFVFVSLIIFLLIFFSTALFVKYRKKKIEHILEKNRISFQYQQQILRAQLEIQEQTFNHISQEIHDNVGQVLSLAKVQINIMNETDNMDKMMLTEVKENVGKALADLRDIAKSLSSERMKNTNIEEAVRIEAERINRIGYINAAVTSEGVEVELDQHKRQIVFRMVQECLQNIMKHAQASEVNLHFHYSPGVVVVIVTDNGKGFDVNKVMSEGSGLGLQNIRTRASLIGGALSITSTLYKGSTITIKVPND